MSIYELQGHLEYLPRKPNAPSRYAKVAKIMGSAEVSSNKSGKNDVVSPAWNPPPIGTLQFSFDTVSQNRNPNIPWK